MSIFKLFFKIIKRNKLTFILALVINLAITFAYVQVTKDDQLSSFSAEKRKIAVVNQDDGAVAQALEEYLAASMTIVPINSDSKSQQDALFFKKVLYIATIPADFSVDLLAGKEPLITTKAVPNSQGDYQATALINQFISKVTFYQGNFPEKNTQEILELVENNLTKEAAVTFEASTGINDKKDVTARIFNLLAYGLFMTIMSSIGFVSIAINKSEIKKRNNCSPLSQRKQSRYFALAVGLFSLFSWAVFVTMNLSLAKVSLTDPLTILLVLNSLVFLLTMISLSDMLSYFTKNHEMLSALNNIMILGTCFISGAFVPQELMNQTVLKFSAFFPTYWFITNNNLLATLTEYKWEQLASYGFNIGVLLLFTLIFTLISFISRKENGGRKKALA